MKGKISKIKDTKGELALPITTVEAIYMEDGITKLSDEMKDVLKYEEFDNESVTTEIPSVKEEINGIKKDISEINSSLEESVKFEVVGEGLTVPPINGGGSYVYDDTEIRELINETNASLDTKANKSEVDNNINELDVKIAETKEELTNLENAKGTVDGNLNVYGDIKLFNTERVSNSEGDTILSSSESGKFIYFRPGGVNNANGQVVLKENEFVVENGLVVSGNAVLNGGINIPNSSINLIGYTKLPNGLIMQWGRLTMNINPPDSFSFDVTLPIAFPTETLYCSGNVKYNFTKDNDHYIEHINVSIQTLGSDRLRIKGRDVVALDVASRFQVHWFAIGY